MKEFIETIRTKNFTFLWGSQVISQFIFNTLSFLIITRIFELTGSTIAVSFVWVSYALPALLFGPLGAVTADIADKRKVMTVSILLQAAVVFVFAYFYAHYVFLSYAVVFIYSMINQFYMPSEAAALPQIVARNRLPQANSLFFITVQVGLVAGFTLAGVFYNSVGIGPTLLASSFLLLAAAINLKMLPLLRSGKKIPKGFEKGVVEFFSDIVIGYKFIKNTKAILFPFILLIGLQAALSVVVVNLPVITSDILKTKASFSGLLIIAPAAVGALIGTALISKLLTKRVRKRRLIEYGLFVLALCLLILSTIVPVVYFWIGRPLAILVFLFAGASYVFGLIPSLTYLQEVTPEDLMGRVFGNIWFITTVVTVIPVLFSATITEIFGVRLLLFILGVVGVAVVLLSRTIIRKVSNYAKRL